MEKNYLQQFRLQSLDQLEKLRPENIITFDRTDIPINYTLVARPNDHILEVFKKLYFQLQDIEPNHYYYPYKDLHLTLIGNIPVDTDLENLIDAINVETSKTKFQFNLRGLGSNRYCSSVSCYPVDFSLHELRKNIRNRIHVHGDNYSTILESYEYVGWINYLRYLHKPSQQFLNKLFSYRDTDFGKMQSLTIQLYSNTSKVLDSRKAKLIHTFAV